MSTENQFPGDLKGPKPGQPIEPFKYPLPPEIAEKLGDERPTVHLITGPGGMCLCGTDEKTCAEIVAKLLRTEPNKLCLCGERHDGIDHEPECPVHGRNEQPEQTGETIDYGAPTPETNTFMTLIDDSEIDLRQVESKLSDMENERNHYKRQRDAALAELAGIRAAVNADKARLERMDDGTVLSRQGLVMLAKMLMDDEKQLKSELAAERKRREEVEDINAVLRHELDMAKEGRGSDFKHACNITERLMAAESELSALKAKLEKAEAFKTWVHDYLDKQGIPHHPPGTHGAEGCRIGDRMDWLMAELTTAKQRLSNLLARIHRDGGRYESSRGTEKAYGDADILCAHLVANVDRATLATCIVQEKDRADAAEKELATLRAEMAEAKADSERTMELLRRCHPFLIHALCTIPNDLRDYKDADALCAEVNAIAFPKVTAAINSARKGASNG